MTAIRASAIRESAFRPSAAGSRIPQLMAEQPIPVSPTPVPVTCHLEWCPPANHPVSGLPLSSSFPPPATWGCHPPPETCIHFCTFAQAVGRFAPLHLGQHVVLSLPKASLANLPTGQRVNSGSGRLRPEPIRLAPSEIGGLMVGYPHALLVAPRPSGFACLRDGGRRRRPSL